MRAIIAGGLGVAVLGSAAVGQWTGVPYRVTTIERGVRTQSANVRVQAAWDGGVGMVYSTMEGVAIGRWEPSTGETEQITVRPRRNRAVSPTLLGETQGRMVFTEYSRGEGHVLWSVARSGELGRLGVIAEEEYPMPTVLAGASPKLAIWVAKPEGWTDVWETDGTAEGTCSVSRGPGIGLAWWSGDAGGSGSGLIESRRDGLSVTDVCGGEGRTILRDPAATSLRGVYPTGPGRAVLTFYGEPGAVYETDGTAGGTRLITRAGVTSWDFAALAEDALVYVTSREVRGMDLRTGVETRLMGLPPRGRVQEFARVGTRVVAICTDETRTWMWSFDGTQAGTRTFLDEAGRISSVGLDATMGVIELWANEAHSGVYVTDGETLARTDATFANGRLAQVIDGRAYFGQYYQREGDGLWYAEPWVVEPGAGARPIGTFVMDIAKGAWDVVSATELGGRMVAMEWPSGSSLTSRVWSTSGDAGDWSAVPNGLEEQHLSLGRGGPDGGLWSLAHNGMRAAITVVRDVDRGVEVVSEWDLPQVWGESVAGAWDGRIVGYVLGEVVWSDGTEGGTRRYPVVAPEQLEEVFWPRLAWCDGWAGLSAWTYVDGATRTRVWRVDDTGVRELGLIPSPWQVFAVGGRMYMETTEEHYELWIFDGEGEPERLVRSSPIPTFVGERGGWAYFIGGSAGETRVVRVRSDDRELAGQEIVATVPARISGHGMRGSRLVLIPDLETDPMFTVDLETGAVERLPLRGAYLGPGENGRLFVMTDEGTDGGTGLWVTDGTPAGTTQVPRPAGTTPPYQSMAMVGGRLILKASTDDAGVQLYAANLCAGDHDGDGGVDFSDYAAFVRDFETGAASADADGDGFIDLFDYLRYLQAFEAGC